MQKKLDEMALSKEQAQKAFVMSSQQLAQERMAFKDFKAETEN